MKPCDSCIDYDNSHGGCDWCKKHEYGLHLTIEAALLPTPVVTNYNRLISKTPEEMADLFEHLCCPYSLGGKVDCNAEKTGCRECWLAWLNSTADKEENDVSR